MTVISRIYKYLSPIAHLGDKRYSFWLPLVLTLVASLILEVVAFFILTDPEAIGIYAILVNLILIVYSSFRWGQIGGLAAVIGTLGYYIYIIYNRQYSGERFNDGINAVAVFGILYLLLVWVIGWLKQTIDNLIVGESNERRRLRAIIQQLPAGVIVTDVNGTISVINDQVEKIIGERLEVGTKVGENLSMVRDPETKKEVKQSELSVVQALKMGKIVKGREYIVNKPDGKEAYILVNSGPVYDEGGQTVAGVSTIQDITLMREVEKRKDDFVNMASHELKTPITSMILYLDLLKKRLVKKDLRKVNEAVSGISKQATNLQELIAELLDVARMQTGKISLQMKKFRLDKLVSEVVKAIYDDNGHQVIRIIKKPKVEVVGDSQRIYQVLANLIANALKYSLGKGDINISVEKKADMVVVSVQDFGIGIRKDQRKKIFEKLYQVGSDKANTFPGFGMGLYISSEIVKKHKGKIWVESEEGKGSTFYFSLPL